MKEKKLTLKQRNFLKYYLQTGNISQSALKAGYAFRESGFELLSNPIIQNAYQRLLDEQGITDKKLNQVLLDGLEANKVVGYLHQYKKTKDGKIERIQPDEIISNEFVDVPDMPTRHKYLETGLKLKDKLNKGKVELTGSEGESLVLKLEVVKPGEIKPNGDNGKDTSETGDVPGQQG